LHFSRHHPKLLRAIFQALAHFSFLFSFLHAPIPFSPPAPRTVLSFDLTSHLFVILMASPDAIYPPDTSLHLPRPSCRLALIPLGRR
jgi:hypothetical protein